MNLRKIKGFYSRIAWVLLTCIVCTNLEGQLTFAAVLSENKAEERTETVSENKKKEVSENKTVSAASTGKREKAAVRSVTLTDSLLLSGNQAVKVFIGWDKDTRKDITNETNIDLTKTKDITVQWNFNVETVRKIGDFISSDPSYQIANYTYQLQIPKEITVAILPNEQIITVDNAGIKKDIAKINVIGSGDNKSVEIVFLEQLKECTTILGDKMGYELFAELDAAKLNDGEITVDFADQNQTKQSQIKMDLLMQKSAADVDLKKTSTSNGSEIKWTIEITPKKLVKDGVTYFDTDIYQMIIEDKLPQGVSFNKADNSKYSLKKGNSLESAVPVTTNLYTLDVLSGNIICKIGDGTNKFMNSGDGDKLFLQLTTPVDLSNAAYTKYTKPDGNGNIVEGLEYTFENKANVENLVYQKKEGKIKETVTVSYNGTEPGKNAAAKENMQSILIGKAGKQSGGVIEWTISVNQAGMNLGEVTVEDQLPMTMVELPAGKTIFVEKYTGGSWQSQPNQSCDANGKISFTINPCDAPYRVKFQTDLKNKLENNQSISNNVTLGTGKGQFIGRGLAKSGAVFAKTAETTIAADRQEDVLRYIIRLNQNIGTIQKPVISDYLPKDVLLLSTEQLSDAGLIPASVDGKNRYDITGEFVDSAGGTVDYQKPVKLNKALPSGSKVYYYVDNAASADKKYRLEIIFNTAEITDGYEIILLPKVINPDIWKVNNSDTEIPNTATLSSNTFGTDKLTSTAKPKINHKVVEKKFESYDPIEHIFQWTITVNDATVQLPDPVVTDTLPEGHRLVTTEDIKIKGVTASETAVGSRDPGKYQLIKEAKNDKVVFYVPNSTGKGYLNERCTIEFYSKLEDAYIASAGSSVPNITYSNIVELGYTGSSTQPAVKQKLKTDVPAVLHDKLLDKTGNSTNINSTNSLNWEVKINENGFKIPKAVVTDDFPERVVLNTGVEVGVYLGTTVNAANKKVEGTDYKREIVFVEDSSGKSHQQLKITFLKEIKEPYLITYTTFVVPDGNGMCNIKVSNQVKLGENTGGEVGTKFEVAAKYSASNAWLNYKKGSLGALTIHKADAADTTMKLAGAKYQVNGPLGYNFILTTDSNGTAYRDSLPIGDYAVQEVQAPAGYDLNQEIKTVTVTPDETKPVSVNFINQKSKNPPSKEENTSNNPSNGNQPPRRQIPSDYMRKMPDITVKPVIPQYKLKDVPNPSSPDSPEYIKIENRNGTFKRTQNPDGTYSYINEFGEVLETVARKGVATSDTMPLIPVILVTAMSMLGAASMIVYKKNNKKDNKQDHKNDE